MSGTPLQQFNMFMEYTSPVYLSDPNHIINEAASRTHVFPYILKDRTAKTTFQSGSEIRETIQFENKGTAANRLPMEVRSYSNKQSGTTTKAYWRFTDDYMVWTEAEILLNEGGNNSSEAFRRAKYKSVRNAKEQQLWTSLFEFMDDAIMRVPVGLTYGPTQMESETGRHQMSIFAMINGETNSLYTGWTTKQTVNPVTEPLWKPQVETYASNQIITDVDTSLIRAFDNMYEAVKFTPPDMKRQYFEEWNPSRQTIFTSRRGKINYAQALRAQKDTYALGRQDPAFPNPVYQGTPVVSISRMDTAAAWDNGTKTQDNATVPHPRYLWINGNYTVPIFHTDKYFAQDKPERDINQPDTYIQRVECWWNVLYTSLQRQGIVAPVAP